MVRALILFTKESVANKQAYPDALKRLLELRAKDELEVDVCTYDDLTFVIAEDVRIVVGTAGYDLSEYDVVYLRRIHENAPEAMAVGTYCLAKGISVMDEEIALRPGSMNKLTQHVKLALAQLPLPLTVYSLSHQLLTQMYTQYVGIYPVIAKSVSGTRGNDNFLIQSPTKLAELLQKHSTTPFMLQEFIPNSCDYRVWVCGNSIGPILKRSRANGHTNNTSKGGDAILLQKNALPTHVLGQCIQAVEMLKRDVAGVDVVFKNDNLNGQYYFFEVNRAPQIEGTPYAEVKADALAQYIIKKGTAGPKDYGDNAK